MCTVLQFKNCPISLSFTNLIFAFFTFLSIFFHYQTMEAFICVGKIYILEKILMS